MNPKTAEKPAQCAEKVSEVKKIIEKIGVILFPPSGGQIKFGEVEPLDFEANGISFSTTIERDGKKFPGTVQTNLPFIAIITKE